MFEETQFYYDLLSVMSDICEMLDIEEPAFCIEADGPYATKTTMAAVSFGESIIMYLNPVYFSPEYGIGPIQIFSIGHELRHIYQRENGESFVKYVKANELTLGAYNKQWQETDANAFGYLCIESFFGEEALDQTISACFFNLPDDVIRVTKAWMDVIIDNEPELFEE